MHLAYDLRDIEGAPLTYSEHIQHFLCEHLVVNMKKNLIALAGKQAADSLLIFISKVQLFLP